MPLVNMMDSIIVVKRLAVAGFTENQALAAFGQLTGMAMSIVNLPSVITVAMSMSLVPTISEAFALGNKVKARKDTQSAIKVTLLIVLPCAFGDGVTCTPIMQLLFPKEPTTVGTILLFLTPLCSILRTNTVYEWDTSRFGETYDTSYCLGYRYDF